MATIDDKPSDFMAIDSKCQRHVNLPVQAKYVYSLQVMPVISPKSLVSLTVLSKMSKMPLWAVTLYQK